ncbi:hypothetical protein [Paraburkholderia agricolaris]|uniref:hypothetical protein n=1 Tax=Paraburkholderia agricolaris TaxID=2152888 RepID=UPI001291992B|nr:hypothetical protein [Paraburkholderia agricolaris]
MYTKGNATVMNKWVRAFFDGPEHSGKKSDNKRYDEPPAEFFTAFGDKMKKWTDHGKRIGVPNSTKTGYVWTPGTDEKYFKDNTESGLLYRKGWGFAT